MDQHERVGVRLASRPIEPLRCQLKLIVLFISLTIGLRRD